MRAIVIFFLLTFLVSWSLFIAAANVSRNVAPGSTFSAFGYAIYLIGVFTPGLVAVLLSWREQRRAGVIALLSQMLRAPSHFAWYLFAVGYFLMIKLMTALIYRVVVGEWPVFGHESFVFIAAAVIFSTPFQAGEELGWRGFALPRLSDRLGLPVASIIIGIIWAAWHLPFFFFVNADKFGQSFPVYLVSVVALSVTMAWLYWRTGGSLLLVMLMHSAINNTTGTVPSALPMARNPWSIYASPIAWISTVLLCMFAIYFLIAMRRAKISET
jgi:membrane protease YdiL (CAAX protease family)